MKGRPREQCRLDVPTKLSHDFANPDEIFVRQVRQPSHYSSSLQHIALDELRALRQTVGVHFCADAGTSRTDSFVDDMVFMKPITEAMPVVVDFRAHVGYSSIQYCVFQSFHTRCACRTRSNILGCRPSPASSSSKIRFLWTLQLWLQRSAVPENGLVLPKGRARDGGASCTITF